MFVLFADHSLHYYYSQTSNNFISLQLLADGVDIKPPRSRHEAAACLASSAHMTA